MTRRLTGKLPGSYPLPDFGRKRRVIQAQMIQGAHDGIEVRELGEIASPLNQVSLPEVDELLAEVRAEPVQLTLGRADRDLSGAYLPAFRVIPVAGWVPRQHPCDSAE